MRFCRRTSGFFKFKFSTFWLQPWYHLNLNISFLSKTQHKASKTPTTNKQKPRYQFHLAQCHTFHVLPIRRKTPKGRKLQLQGDIGEKMRKRSSLVTCIILQGFNISPQNGILKMIFLFPRWDMLISWRVYKLVLGCLQLVFFPMVFHDKKFASTWYAHFFPRDFRHYMGTRPNISAMTTATSFETSMHGYAAAWHWLLSQAREACWQTQ